MILVWSVWSDEYLYVLICLFLVYSVLFDRKHKRKICQKSLFETKDKGKRYILIGGESDVYCGAIRKMKFRIDLIIRVRK